jgi:hypothetical protein
MSYLNGFAILSAKSGGFAGTETWEELNFVARFQLQASPALTARGMLGMLSYDATAVLKEINVPALAFLAPAKHTGLIEHHNRFAEIVRRFGSRCIRTT